MSSITQDKVHALSASLDQPANQPTGTYDIIELRKRLEQRMEYSKVKPIPHDPAMDPDETIPSYATSTGVMEREVATGQSM